MVDVPSFMVTVESEKHVDLREDSTLQPHSETLVSFVLKSLYVAFSNLEYDRAVSAR